MMPREVSLPGGQYAVSDQGAQVTRWSGDRFGDLLYLSSAARFAPGEAIRGGVPICFPWFGGGPDGDLSPSHGFARIATWRAERWVVTERTGVLDASYQLTPEDVAGVPGREHMAAQFAVRYDIALAPDHARFTLRVTNDGDAAFSFEAALHTYLRVGDISEVSIQGLEDASYRDKTGGFARRVQDGAVRLGAEVDRIYDSTADVVLHDTRLGRTLRVGKLGSPHTVVWNPGEHKASAMDDVGEGEWRQFVCVEAAVVAPEQITLEPGQRHELEQRIWVS